MNIFAVSPDTEECAIALDDKRLNKMILETAQLLSTAIHSWGYPESERVYKPTHVNHPCSIWVQSDKSNFTWTTKLLSQLGLEWHYRKSKSHASWDKIYPCMLRICNSFEDVKSPSSWCNCTPYDQIDVHESYRLYMVDKWNNDICNGRPPVWTRRSEPWFFNKHE